MKFFSPRKSLAFLLLLFLFIIIIKCKTSKPQEFEIYRFTDHLSEKCIIDSPLKELLKKFNFIKQDLTKKWMYIPSISSKEREVWAASSKFQILAFDESKRPEGMKITRDGKDIDFVGDTKNRLEGWTWLQTTERKKLKKYEKFSKKFRGILIREGDSFRMEEILPDSEVNLSFHISNINCKDYTPHLVVSLNNEPVKDILLNKPDFFIIREKIKLGDNRIEFKFPVPEGRTKRNKNNFIVVRGIRIEAPKDIILLFSPKREDITAPQERYQARYYTLFSESKEKSDSARKDILSLYVLKEKYPIEDLGITNNPYSIIKKALLDEYSLNCLFAPPKSRFLFKVKIPEKSYLEFGCGFLSESFEKTNNKVHFQIELEYKKRKKILFSKEIRPSDNKIGFKKIDLAPYENKEIKIYLTTDSSTTKKNDNSKINNSFTIWVNPLIYKKLDKNRINFILISIDTLRADHLGCYGYLKKTSPHLDRLSDEAVIFENAFSTTSWTLPAHVSLLTSLDSPNHGVFNSLQKLNPSLLTLADILRNHGYFCAAFTGGGYLHSKFGFSKGFDAYQQIIKDGDLSVRFNESESLSGRTSEWLDKNYEKKFLLFLHTYQPHTPYANNSDVGKIFLSKNAQWNRIIQKEIFGEKGQCDTVLSQEEKENVIALYDGEIRYTDEYLIKPLINKLRELNIYDNTVLIVTSDHGEEFYEHKNWLHGVTLYNESIQIPLIIKFPDSLYKGTKISNIVRITDIMPTVLEIAKINPSSFKLDGKSLLSIIKGEEREDRIFYCDLILRKLKDPEPSIFATNKNSLKLILNKRIRSPYTKEISTEFEGQKLELYDIKKDFYETKNIANKNSYNRLCKELIEKIEQYLEIGRNKKAESIKMDEELKRSLKALGYLK